MIGLALKWLGKNPLLILILLLATALGAQSLRLKAERKSRVAAELLVDAMEARSDTTSLLYVNAVRGFQRRIVQLGVEADSLDKALGTESVARQTLEVRVASLTARDTAAVEVDTATDVRRLAVARYSEPYTYTVVAELPAPPQPGILTLDIALDQIVLKPRITCGVPPEGSLVRPARLFVEAPTWASVRLEDLRQSAGVCNPYLTDSPGLATSAIFTTTVGAFAGGAAVVLTGGDIQETMIGMGVGIGFAWLVKIVF